ncbi:MAG: hypothetical protein MJZ60_02905 [Bacteroidaceae bacterium]|nr:hypothetical protein [Bacteroidaceae bacterium]
MASWLINQPFAHGDLKPDNILVNERCGLTLVDYDGLYVPGMQGEGQRECGTPGFRHPLRPQSAFDERIDDFSFVSILLSIYAFASSPHGHLQPHITILLFTSFYYLSQISSCTVGISSSSM